MTGRTSGIEEDALKNSKAFILANNLQRCGELHSLLSTVSEIGKVVPAHLIPLPVIAEPFTRIAMDILGPLPRSSSDNQYVLVLSDKTTSYPEAQAVLLHNIDAKH